MISNQQRRKDVIVHNFLKDDVARILRIPLPRVPQSDKLIWHFAKDGNYSIKSGYQIALKLKFSGGTGSSDRSKTNWGVIWSREIPEKNQDVYVESGSKLAGNNLKPMEKEGHQETSVLEMSK